MTTVRILCALAAGICLSSPVLAQTAEKPPVEREAPAWSAVPRGDKADPATVTFRDQIKAGTPVIGADGERIGKVASVEDADGKVTVVHVQTGEEDAPDSSMIAVTLDKIAALTASSLTLSVSAADAQKLPAPPAAEGGK